MFLSNNLSVTGRLLVWLSCFEWVCTYTEKLDCETIQFYKPDIIISYNYKHIINEQVLFLCERPIINLHGSLLPWNKGSDPNFWSFFENTPKGVSIHNMSASVDAGDILLQRELTLDSNIETFRSSYDKLHDAMFDLFTDNWESLKKNIIPAISQTEKGTYHTKKDSIQINSLLPIDYDIVISDYLKQYSMLKLNEVINH